MTQQTETITESNEAGLAFMEAMLAVRQNHQLQDSSWHYPYNVLEFGLRKSGVRPENISELSIDVLRSIARNAAIGLESKRMAREAEERLAASRQALIDLSLSHHGKQVMVLVNNDKTSGVTEYRYGKWHATPTYAHGRMIADVANAYNGEIFRLQALRTSVLGRTKLAPNTEYSVRPRRSILELPGISLRILDM